MKTCFFIITTISDFDDAQSFNNVYYKIPLDSRISWDQHHTGLLGLGTPKWQWQGTMAMAGSGGNTYVRTPADMALIKDVNQDQRYEIRNSLFVQV